MIGIAKTDEDARNEYGLPVTANVPDNRGNFHQQVDQSRGKNDALPWVSFSWLLSGLALGMIVIILAVAPAYIEAQVAKAVAQAKAEMAQDVADAKASADTGRQHARVALDKVEDFRAKLAEKGFNVTLDGH